MKFTVDVDCTPKEARAFLGLPDVAPMQQAMMAEVEQRIKAGLAAMDTEALFKAWMPFAAGGMEGLQKAFFSQFAGGPAKRPKKEDEKAGQ